MSSNAKKFLHARNYFRKTFSYEKCYIDYQPVMESSKEK